MGYNTICNMYCIAYLGIFPTEAMPILIKGVAMGLWSASVIIILPL